MTLSFKSWVLSGFKPLLKDTKEYSDMRMILLIISATVVTCVIGFSFKDAVERAFTSVKLTGSMLLITGTLLLLSRLADRKDHPRKHMKILNALLIGLAQSFALLPGISRSGSTIAVGLFQGIDKDVAARFSFYIAVPAIIGATVLKGFDLRTDDIGMFPSLMPGFLASVITGIFAIKILLKHISAGKFWIYSFWCFIAGTFTLVFL
jgi:undecaprenyl-diphosphatase